MVQKRKQYKRKPLRLTATKNAKAKAVERVKVNNVKKIVRRVLKKDEEVKCGTLQVFQQNIVLGAGLNSSTGYGLTTTGIGGLPTSIVPLISNGTGMADRIGAYVNGKSLMVKYSLRALDTTGNTAGTNPFRGKPMYVRVVIYNHRYALDDYGNINILQKGNTTGNLDSLPDSYFERYNNKEFKIFYSKTFKLSAFSDTGSTPPTLENMPNGFSNFIVRRAYIKVPRKLIFNGTNTEPSNFAPKMAVCMCNADGSVVGLTQYRVQVNAESRLYFTDA